jgi:hypothetical protein
MLGAKDTYIQLTYGIAATSMPLQCTVYTTAFVVNSAVTAMWHIVHVLADRLIDLLTALEDFQVLPFAYALQGQHFSRTKLLREHDTPIFIASSLLIVLPP